MTGNGGKITEILGRPRPQGERFLDELFPLVYEEIRAIAAECMRRERGARTLQATALAHEAFLRLGTESLPSLQNRAAFFAVAARAMRQILIEQARARGRHKRGGRWRRVTIGDFLPAEDEPVLDLLALEEALDHLGRSHPRRARVVELLYFGGLTAEEAGMILGVTSRTVERDWQAARRELGRRLGSDATDEETFLPRSWASPIAGPVRLGRYLIVREIARGGMGYVFEAYDQELHRRLAIKQLPPSWAKERRWRNAFCREAQLLGAFDHPQIETIYTMEESQETLFLTLELLTGGSLADYLDKLGGSPLPQHETIELARSVVAALVTMHAENVTHGDLKPENIVFDENRSVRVLDFGLARFRGRGSGTVLPATAASGEWVAGTPGYLSPSRIEGAPPTPDDDLWAFGAVLYECLTGQPAFGGATAAERHESARRVSAVELAFPETVSEEFRTIVRKCLATRANSRWSSARELEEALRLVPPETQGTEEREQRGRKERVVSKNAPAHLFASAQAKRAAVPFEFSLFDGGWTIAAAHQIVSPGLSLDTVISQHRDRLASGAIVLKAGPRAITDQLRFELPERAAVDSCPPRRPDDGDSHSSTTQSAKKFDKSATAQSSKRSVQSSKKFVQSARRFVAFYAEQAQSAADRLTTSSHLQAMARLDADHRNFLVALELALKPDGQFEGGLSLLVSLEKYWTQRGELELGREWTDAYLERIDAAQATALGDPVLVVHARNAAGNWRLYHGETRAAAKCYEDALATAVHLKDRGAEARGAEARGAEARSLHNIGGAALQAGDLARARGYFEQNLAMAQADHDRPATGRVLSNLGIVEERSGNWTAAEAHYRSALRIFQKLEDHRMTAILLSNIGSIALIQGELETARVPFAESLELFRDLDDRRGVAATLGGYGIVLQNSDDVDRALPTLKESLEIYLELSDRHGVWKQICQIALLCVQVDRAAEATLLLAAAQRMREENRLPYPPHDRAQVDRHVERCRRSLSTETFASAWDRGLASDLTATVTLIRELSF